VLLDYRLPDLDGLEFLSRLQPDASEIPLPIVVLTGAGNDAISVQAIKAGAQDYLIKEQLTSEGLQLRVNRAIAAVELHTQLQQRIEGERVIAQITQRMHRSLNLDDILQTSLTEIRQFLHTDRVLVFQSHADGNGTVVAESVGSEWRSLLASTIYDPCLAENHLKFSRPGSITHDPAFAEDYVRRYRQGQVTAIDNIHDSAIDPCHIELLASFQVQANLVVPILHDDQFWGLLIAHHCSAPRLWKSLEIDLLKELATHLGIALRQTELYEQAQHELADRKQTEAALHESEERLRVTLKASRMGTWDWNIQTGTIIWSENLEEMFGLEPGAFDGSYEMFVSRLHPDDRDRVLSAVQHAVTTGEDYNIDFRVVYPNGRIRWARSQGKVFYDRNGQPIRMAGNDIDITERKQSEAALQESEARLKLAHKATQSGLWDWDMARNVATVSEEYCTLLGFDPSVQEVSFDEWLSRVHPDDRVSASEAVREIIQQQQQYYTADYRIVHPDGIRWVAARGQVFYNAAGTAVRLLGNVQDITSRKQAEELLRQSEEFKRRILDSSSDCIKLMDINGQLLYVNTGGLCLLEIDDFTPYLNMAWTGFWQEDDRDAVEAAIATARAGELGRFQGFCPTAKGTPKWWDVIVTPIFDTRGQVEKILATSRDITDRKQAEELLRRSEERYRTLFESMEDGFCVIEMLFDETNTPIDYHFLETNPAFEQQSGLEQAVGKTARQLLPDLESHWFETYGRVALTGEPVRFESGSDAMNRWFDVYAFRIGPPESHRVAILFKNISERKLAEQEREQLLMQEQAARAEAERANRIKDEFLAVLSHELRSPLNPILGWTKLLQTRTFDPANTAKALATIERNANLQTQLIDDLLDMAKILRGKFTMNAVPVKLAFVIESAIETMRTAAVAKNILLNPVLHPTGLVHGDAVRLQQVVWNLLSNAIKFTPNNGHVDIRLEQVGHQAQLTVSDTGKGIDPKFLPHIFESFRQEDVSITRKYGGLGLGLAIVRSLVEAHGGTIMAASPGEGLGATFTVRLPLLRMAIESQQPEVFSTQALDLSKIRILIVDDEPDARELLTVILTQYGADVLTVASAAEVLANLETFQPDVLVSDIGMPEVDGYTLIQQIRTLPPEKGGQLPAIALTAYAREDDYQRAISNGYQQHITKPLEPERLVQAVMRLCKQ
jgi:PAS domain S-box-containing protein